MKELLVLIDMQKGFMNKHTLHLVNEIRKFVDKVKFDDIVATRYINNENTACYKFEGWKDCMEGTAEAELVNELADIPSRVFDKNVYSCWTKEFQEYVKNKGFDKVYFVGVNTGCCVLHSAFDCYNDVQDCAVIYDLCGSTSGFDSHKVALQVLRECITKERVVSTSSFY